MWVPRPLGGDPGPIILPAQAESGAMLVGRYCCVGDFPTARDCAVRGLDHGRDSTWHMLRLSAMASWRLDTLEPTASFRSAVYSIGESDAARQELGWHLEAPFRFRHECLACLVQGIFNMGWHPMFPLLDEGRLSPIQRRMFAQLPPVELLAWIEREIELTREALAPSSLRASPLYLPRTAQDDEIWHRGGELTRRIFKHFHRTSYRNGSFRACYTFIDFPRPPCTPRHLTLPNSYLTTTLAVANIWDSTSGRPLTLLTWAVAGADLGREAWHPDKVSLEWRRWGITTGTQWDSSAVMPVPSGPAPPGWLIGVTPIPTGNAPTVSMMLTQGAARRGGVFVDGLAPLDTGPIAISDPLLGQEGTGAVWRVGSELVPLSPFWVFARREVVTMAFQVRAARPVAGARLRIRILAKDDHSGDDGRERITIIMPVEVPAGIDLHTKEIRMPDLEPGDYRFEIALLDGDAAVTAPRGVSFILVKR